MYSYNYPHPAVTADNVVFCFDDKDLNVLLVKRKNEPCKDCWAFPGGFMNIDETIEQCAERELKEETNFKVQRMEQLMVFSSVNRDPRERVITVAFLSLARIGKVKGGDDASEAKWFKLKDIPKLAFDHGDILKIALERLRERVYFEPVCFELLDDVFSAPTLQRVYEAILGVKFDTRNFLRKMNNLGILDRTEENQQNKKKNQTYPTKKSKLHNKTAKENTETDGIQVNKERNRRSAVKYSLNKAKYEQIKKNGLRLEF